MKKFNIGGRVRVINTFAGSDLRGKTGTVICINENCWKIGIEFDDKIYAGHSCNGIGKMGYCRYSDDLDELELIESKHIAKYKVGEKVRVREWDDMVKEYGTIGNVCIKSPYVFMETMRENCGKILEVKYAYYSEWGYLYNFGDSGYWYHEGVLRPVVFTKSDLQSGDIIKKRDGDVEIVILPLGVCVRKDGAHNSLDGKNEDLTSKNGSKFDIIEVRRPLRKSDCSFNAFEIGLGKLVYKREDKPKYYNGKVVCIANKYKNSASCAEFTVGKVYEVKNGLITDDKGWVNGVAPAETIENLCVYIGNEFIPLVEE